MRYLIILLLLIPLNSIADYSICYYVNAPDGLNIRKAPSIKAKVLGRLTHGEALVNYTWTDNRDTLLVDNKKQAGTWVRLYYNGDTGYVFDRFIAPYRTVIEEHTLYYPCFSLEYNSKYDYGRLPCWYFNTDTTTPDMQFWGGDTVDYTTSYKLELVDVNKYKRRQVYNKYAVDRTPIQKYLHPDREYPDTFYLPLNHGKDTLILQDEHHEFITEVKYIGQIKHLNCYVISYCFEGCHNSLYNKTSGKEIEVRERGKYDEYIHNTFTSGVQPIISPDGKLVVSFVMTYSFYPDRFCDMSIYNLDLGDTIRIESKTGGCFRSWAPDTEYPEAFWISNNEVIIKVMPVDFHLFCEGLSLEERKALNFKYQYLKLTIL